ncbi:hypothetical protein K469DRAFT_667762 [Zopfia rhizophila CBS 207.26]|uniref:Uncharacterized protein n=1 Tax=Zopfia rhizophila CBS 207.26 TaxID=1314779 RepID=A0A6A6DWC8_9PEZI|nr:hypothetical protein K469DRAFT_667762 [Zopfia rhizophila CBS 207.26]
MSWNAQLESSSKQHGVAEKTVSAPSTLSEFAWTVPISIDTAGESFLSGIQSPVPEDSSIPREIIAEELRSTFFQAELKRPLHLGLHSELPAYLLHFSFSFQRSGSNSRIRAATVTITFDDAPTDTEENSDEEDEDAPPPAILDFYPKDYKGPVFKATVERSTEVSLAVSSGGIVTPGVKVCEKKTLEEEGRLAVHGVTRGRPKHKVIWTIRENEVSKKGIPNTIQLPLIVRPQNGRRFSASLVIHAKYGIRRGVLAKIIPVLGRLNEPIYFDPTVLRRMAKNKERSRFDGNIVAEEVGGLTDCDLVQHSSLQ